LKKHLYNTIWGIKQLLMKLLVVVSVCCILCFVLPPKQSGVLECHHIISYLKIENYELCFLARIFADQITTGKNYDPKKKKVLSSGRRLK
jgi:hypothetical protein